MLIIIIISNLTTIIVTIIIYITISTDQMRAVLMQLQSGGTSVTSTVATVKWP